MSTSDLDLPDLKQAAAPGTAVGQANQGPAHAEGGSEDEPQKLAADLQPVFDVPVSVQAVIGKTKMEVSELLRLAPGSVLELDRRVDERTQSAGIRGAVEQCMFEGGDQCVPGRCHGPSLGDTSSASRTDVRVVVMLAACTSRAPCSTPIPVRARRSRSRRSARSSSVLRPR